MTYAIPDLHGRADLLDQALKAIAAHAVRADGERKVVSLGDYVDRGPDSRKVLDRLMGGPPPGWRWICLKGNHEQMMLEACRGIAHPEVWLSNGGYATLQGFSLAWREIEPYEVPAPYVDWLDGLASMHVDRHRVYVHAGLDRRRGLDEQREDDLLWNRDPDPDVFKGSTSCTGMTRIRAVLGSFLGGRTSTLWRGGRGDSNWGVSTMTDQA